MSDQERNLKLTVSKKTAIGYAKDVTILDLFFEQVVKVGDEIAVVYKKQKLTYNELDRLSNQLAYYLISKKNVLVGDLVGIMLERSEMQIVCIMGILKSGAAYVPIDSQYPQQRINYIKDDSNCKFTLDLHALENFVVDKEKYSINPASLATLNPNDLAYIIYTSGSTGNPKGVMIQHRNLLKYLVSVNDYIDKNSNNSGCFAHLSISFDASITEIFLPLLAGKKLILTSETGLEIFNDINLFKYAPYDFIKLTPSHINLLTSVINKKSSPKLTDRYIIGGEALYSYHIDLFKTNGIDAVIVNEYGPTEATVGCCTYEFNVFGTAFTNESIPIGKPISKTQIYILDKNQKLVPEGEMGEIVIAGDGVSLGYLNRPELTKERFILDPFAIKSESKMYLSGDLGKLLPNGNLAFLGRLDEQVKIRGYRIEIGEIEHHLLSIDGIKSAVVLVKTDILVCFIVTDSKILNEIDTIQLWKNHLTLQLPVFMIPQAFYIIETIPTTSNGKIDRKALLDYLSNYENTKKYTKPRSEEEKLVASIWKKNLNIDKIDIFRNFFEMGGHSIKAVKIITDIEKQTGKRISLSALFEHDTIEKFAKLLQFDNDYFGDCLVPLKSNGNKTPIFMIHGGGLNVLSLVNMSKHFDDDQPFYGIQGIGPKGYDDWYESVESMAAHYIEAIVKVNPKGPYALAGFCIGGIIAFEITRQLKEQGKKVSMTVLLDSYIDSSYFYKTYREKKLVRYYNHTRRRLSFLKEMLMSRRAFIMRINTKKQYLQNKYLKQNDTVNEQEFLANEQFKKATSMVNRILDRYHLKPQNFKVDLIRSKNHPEHIIAPAHLGWQKAALDGVKIHNIPGDNFDIKKPPFDKVLARIIQEISNKCILLNLNFFLIFEF